MTSYALIPSRDVDAAVQSQDQRGRGRDTTPFAQSAIGLWTPDCASHQPTDDAEPSTSIKVDANVDLIIEQAVNIYFRPKASGDTAVRVFYDDGTVLTEFAPSWSTSIAQWWRVVSSSLSIQANTISTTNVGLSGNITGVYVFNATHLDQVTDMTSLTNYQSLQYARCQPTQLSNGVTAFTYPEVVPWNDAKKDLFPTTDESGYDYMPRQDGSVRMTGTGEAVGVVNIPFSYANYGAVRIDCWFPVELSTYRFTGTAKWVNGPGGVTTAQMGFTQGEVYYNSVRSWVLYPNAQLKQRRANNSGPGAYLDQVSFEIVADSPSAAIDFPIYYKIYYLDSISGSYTGGVHVMRIDGLNEALPVNFFMRSSIEFVPTPANLLTTPVDDAVAVLPAALEAARLLLHNWRDTGMSLYLQKSCYASMLDLLRYYDLDVIREIAIQDPGASYVANASVGSFLKGVWRNTIKPKLDSIWRGGLQIAASDVASPIYGFIPGGPIIQNAIRTVNSYVNQGELNDYPGASTDGLSDRRDTDLYTVARASDSNPYLSDRRDEADVTEFFDEEVDAGFPAGTTVDIADQGKFVPTSSGPLGKLVDILCDQTWPTRWVEIGVHKASKTQRKEYKEESRKEGVSDERQEELARLYDAVEKKLVKTPYTLPRAAFFPVVMPNHSVTPFFMIASIEMDPLTDTGQKGYFKVDSYYTGVDYPILVDNAIAEAEDPKYTDMSHRMARLLAVEFALNARETPIGNYLNRYFKDKGLGVYLTVFMAVQNDNYNGHMEGTSWTGAVISLARGLTSGMAYPCVAGGNVNIPYPKNAEKNSLSIVPVPVSIKADDFAGKFDCWIRTLTMLVPEYQKALEAGTSRRPKMSADLSKYLGAMCYRCGFYVDTAACRFAPGCNPIITKFDRLTFANTVTPDTKRTLADIIADVYHYSADNGVTFVDPRQTVVPLSAFRGGTRVMFAWYTTDFIPMFLRVLPLTKKVWTKNTDDMSGKIAALEGGDAKPTWTQQLVKATGLTADAVTAILTSINNYLAATKRKAFTFSSKTPYEPVEFVAKPGIHYNTLRRKYPHLKEAGGKYIIDADFLLEMADSTTAGVRTGGRGGGFYSLYNS